jgi:hypothetical protein
MKHIVERSKILKLAIEGPVSRKYVLLTQNKIIGELYNQKRDLFYQNFLASLKRLEAGDIDEFKYYLKGQDEVSLKKCNENKYKISYSIQDERSKNKIETILSIK